MPAPRVHGADWVSWTVNVPGVWPTFVTARNRIGRPLFQRNATEATTDGRNELVDTVRSVSDLHRSRSSLRGSRGVPRGASRERDSVE